MKGTKHDDRDQGEQDQREEGGRRQRQQEEEAPEESQHLRQPQAHLSTNGTGNRSKKEEGRRGKISAMATPVRAAPEPRR